MAADLPSTGTPTRRRGRDSARPRSDTRNDEKLQEKWNLKMHKKNPWFCHTRNESLQPCNTKPQRYHPLKTNVRMNERTDGPESPTHPGTSSTAAEPRAGAASAATRPAAPCQAIHSRDQPGVCVCVCV